MFDLADSSAQASARHFGKTAKEVNDALSTRAAMPVRDQPRFLVAGVATRAGGSIAVLAPAESLGAAMQAVSDRLKDFAVTTAWVAVPGHLAPMLEPLLAVLQEPLGNA